jgi:hypothetical protein
MFRVLGISIEYFFFIGITLTCLTISLVFIIYSIDEKKARLTNRHHFVIRSHSRFSASLPPSAKRSLKNRHRYRYNYQNYWIYEFHPSESTTNIIITIVAFAASIIYALFFAYNFTFPETYSVFHFLNTSLSDMAPYQPFFDIVTLIIKFVVFLLLSFIFHMVIIEESIIKVVQPIYLPLKHYKEAGWGPFFIVFGLRISILWFILGSLYISVIGTSLIAHENIDEWFLRVGFSLFLPSFFLAIFYLEVNNKSQEESDPSFSEWKRDYPIVDKLLRKMEEVALAGSDWIGIITKQRVAKFLSYYWSFFAFITFLIILEQIFPQDEFRIFSLPIICCTIIVGYLLIRNTIRHILETGRNHVRRSRGEEIPDKSIEQNNQKEKVNKENMFQTVSKIGKNLAGAYLFFTSSIIMAAYAPYSLVLLLNEVVNFTSETILEFLAIISEIPHLVIINVFEVVLQQPYPGLTLALLMVNIPTIFFLFSTVYNTIILHEMFIYYIIERFNPHQRGKTTVESLSAIGRDLILLYSLFLVIALSYLFLWTLIYYMFLPFR